MYILSHSLSTLDGDTGFDDVQISSEIPYLIEDDRLVEATFIGSDDIASSVGCAYITVRSALGDEFLFPIGDAQKRCKNKGHCSSLQRYFEEAGNLRLNLIDSQSGNITELDLPIEAFGSEREFVLAGLHTSNQMRQAQGDAK